MMAKEKEEEEKEGKKEEGKVSVREMLEKIEARVAEEIKMEIDARVSLFELITPAFIGGIIIGIIVGVPGLNLLIPLILIGGYVAVALVREYYEKYVSENEAAKVGAVAGLIGAFIGALITFIIAVFFAEPVFGFFRGFLNGNIANLILVLSGLDPTISLYVLRLRFLINIVLCMFLGALGGIYYIREKVKKKKK